METADNSKPTTTKRRFAPSLSTSSNPKRNKTETENDEFTEILANFRSEDKEEAKKAGKKLKSLLSNEATISKFVSNRKNVEELVAVFARHTSNLGTELHHFEVHQYAISIIANCCYKTPSTGFILKKANRHFLDLTVRIFESTTANAELKISMCRLIGNLCPNRELVTGWISSNTIIFDRITLLLSSSDIRIVKQALRIFTILSNASFTRVIMLSNGCFYLGKLLSNSIVRDEVVKILKILLKRHGRDLDRQISNCSCSEHVIEMFFEKNGKYRQFVLDLFMNGTYLREQMENESFIERLIESKVPERNRMLAAFSQSAWGRAKLRTSGALDLLVDALWTSKNREERLFIVSAFRHIVHDTAGMRHLSENTVFINTVVRDVNKFVEDFKCECKPAVDLEFVRTLNRKLEELSEKDEKNRSLNNDMPSRLHKDYFSMWSYDTPQTSPRRMLSSPSLSPAYSGSPSSSASFPSSNASSGASSPVIRRSDGILDDLSDIESDNGEEEKAEEEEDSRKDKDIVENELWLLTWQSHDDDNLQFLIRADIVDCVISYLRNTKSPDIRSYRILRRMAMLRTHVYKLLDLQFHIRILTGLCAPPCRMLKYSKSCKRCDTCAEHGREVLREFAAHVDNSYGDAHINYLFEKEDFLARTKAAIAKIVLVKERLRLAKIPALDELFDALRRVLRSREDFEELGVLTTYENGPTLISQIIGALSILISGQRIRELCENDSWYFPDEQGACVLNEKFEEDAEMLNFADENERVFASAPMSKICENSGYFQAMFSSDFAEKTNNVRTFVVESELCSAEDFEAFIHLLIGCTSKCSVIHSAEQCAIMLQLSDHYLCQNISETLCMNDGPLRTFLNGPSLPILLPVALTTNAHPTLLDTVFLTLVRFSSSENVTEAMRAICVNQTMVNTFICKLSSFATSKLYPKPY